MEVSKKFWYGFFWEPCTPYNIGFANKLKQAVCHALDRHTPSRRGSWCFGYDFVCHNCGMYVGPWKKEECQTAADQINKLPLEQQHTAIVKVSGGAK